MYLIEGIVSSDSKELIEEFGQPMGGQAPAPMGGMMGGTAPTADNEGVEFEDIKKYVLFGKLKEIKLKLQMANIDRDDPNVVRIFEFADLLIMFYNVFTYSQARTLLDHLIEMVSSTLKIKLPKPDPKAEPPMDQKVLQQQQMQQQMQMQQQNPQAQQAASGG